MRPFSGIEQFGRLFADRTVCQDRVLGNGTGGAGRELVDGAHEQVFSGVEQPVVNVSRGVVGSNGHFDAAEHVAGVDIVLEEEGAGACGGFTIQNRPMDRGRSRRYWGRSDPRAG